MTKVYKSICLEIDELTLKIIHLSEKLINHKLEVEGTMNNGFVNIAKSRYIMGSKCVSTLQLPTANSNPIHPLVTVCRSAPCGHWVFKSNRKKPSPLPSDEALLKEKIKNDTTRTDIIKDLLEKEPKNLRKRKEFFLVEDSNYKELNDEFQDEVSTDSSNCNESLVTFTDPIRLFGVLVPYTLRIAQKNFQDVLENVLNCATIQSEMLKALERYYHLNKVKKMIEMASEERNIDLTEEKEYWTATEDSEYSYVSAVVPVDSDIGKGYGEESPFEMETEGGIGHEIEGETDANVIIPTDSVEYFKTDIEFDEKLVDEAYENSDTSIEK